jgi:hypothetical protein
MAIIILPNIILIAALDPLATPVPPAIPPVLMELIVHRVPDIIL